MLATIASTSLAHADDPKRDAPDYDGRGNPDADSGSWVLWIPRVVLFPFYVVYEYGIRKPVGAFVTRAERDHWADTIEGLFTFGPEGNNVIYPTALFDFVAVTPADATDPHAARDPAASSTATFNARFLCIRR